MVPAGVSTLSEERGAAKRCHFRGTAPGDTHKPEAILPSLILWLPPGCLSCLVWLCGCPQTVESVLQTFGKFFEVSL